MNNQIIFHSTNANKLKDPLLTHTADASIRKNMIVAHSTNANKLKDPLLTHSTNAVLVKPQILGTTSQVKSATSPQFSKNSAKFISIGGGLSIMVGFPRIATWNTSGRPKNPKKGTTGFNTETKKLEIWNGSTWHKAPLTNV